MKTFITETYRSSSRLQGVLASCCFALLIALLISLLSTVNLNEFIQNISEWQTL